ncbi:MAG: M28 family peptidase, partial [Methyloligellaceae bacterium]
MYRVGPVISACLLSLLTQLSPAAAETGKEAPLLENPRQLTFEGRRAGEGYFSADGRQMIFQSEREAGNPFYQMYIMDLATGDLRRISPGHGKTTCGWIHPNGRRALFASTQDDPKAKEKQKTELETRAKGKRRRYEWSYDEHYDIQEYDLESGSYRNLTRTLGYDAEGAYSPDGKLIVFASNREAYARSLDTKERQTFEHDKSYFMDIYVMNADASNVRRLTKAPGYDGGPFFSADGKKIFWRRFSEDGARAEVYTMNVDGTDKREITRLGALSWAPFFHPSGDYIVFATNLQGFANFELYMVDAKGENAPVRVTYSKGFDGLAAFSPDGKRLAWASKRTADGTTQIFMADWSDTEARRRLGLPAESAAAEPAVAKEPDMDRTADEIRVEDLRLHVASLASEEMDGRLTGTPGETKATQYVAKAFEALGLAPAGDNGDYFQTFEFTAGVSLGTNNALTLTTATGTKTLSLDREWRPLAFSRTGQVDPAGMAFAGYGLAAPAENDNAAYDSYAGLDVSGKWVLVLRGVPHDVTPDRRLALTRYADLRYKASVARSKGAKGLIVAPAPGVKYKDPLVRLSYEASSGTSGLPAISINGATARALLSPASQDLDAVFGKLDKGAAVKGFAVSGVELTGRIDLAFERRRGRNVLARLNTGPKREASLLIVGAHLDHLGRGETSGSLARSEERDQVHYGADDNASGVAGLIEIAQHLAAEHKAGKLKAQRD